MADLIILPPTWTETWVRTRHGRKAHLIVSDLVLTPTPEVLEAWWDYSDGGGLQLLYRGGSISPCTDLRDAKTELRPAPQTLARCAGCLGTLECLADLVDDYRRAYVAQAIRPAVARLRAHHGEAFDRQGSAR
ncbi:hypothetical protein ACGFIV_00840 [Sphaerisporangium sp. NPDC049003]|uniref:hypothetical protein n=1 Tax=Sphaerisporangium sp. NPDC049003 TaxID=3364517 RepID=UPI00371E0048